MSSMRSLIKQNIKYAFWGVQKTWFTYNIETVIHQNIFVICFIVIYMFDVYNICIKHMKNLILDLYVWYHMENIWTPNRKGWVLLGLQSGVGSVNRFVCSDIGWCWWVTYWCPVGQGLSENRQLLLHSLLYWCNHVDARMTHLCFIKAKWHFCADAMPLRRAFASTEMHLQNFLTMLWNNADHKWKPSKKFKAHGCQKSTLKCLDVYNVFCLWWFCLSYNIIHCSTSMS